MNKVLIVVVPHAVSNPRAMMVVFQNAGFALSAMMSSLRFPGIAKFTKLLGGDGLLLWDFGNWSVCGFVVAPENHNGELEKESSDNPFFSWFEVAD